MEKLPESLKNNLLIAMTVCLVLHMFLTRSLFLFVPVFGLVVYLLWKKGGGKISQLEAEEDPADWWKKESRPEDQE